MEYRRFFNCLPGRNLGCETKLAPQLEDYEVFRTGIVDPYQVVPFKIVLNVMCVAPSEIKLSFPEDKVMQVTVKHIARRFEELNFARDCTLSFTIPDEVDPNQLIAKWYEDHYLVINEEECATVTGSGDTPAAVAVPVDAAAAAAAGAGPVDAAAAGAGPVDAAAGAGPDPNGPKNIRILEPIFVEKKFKTIVDVDVIQDLFAEISDNARLEERYMLNYFFKIANLEKLKNTFMGTRKAIRESVKESFVWAKNST